MLPITAGTWVETLTERFDWAQLRDADRVRGAFVTLAGTRRQWPLPQDFMDALPPPRAQQVLEKQSTIPESREARMRRLSDLVPKDLVGKDAAAEQGASE